MTETKNLGTMEQSPGNDIFWRKYASLKHKHVDIDVVLYYLMQRYQQHANQDFTQVDQAVKFLEKFIDRHADKFLQLRCYDIQAIPLNLVSFRLDELEDLMKEFS